MEIVTKKKMLLFTGTTHPSLANEIADELGIEVSSSKLTRFGSGEIYFRAEESVHGADVFVIQTHAEPVNESIMEQLIMIDAMKRASAKRITAVVPYYGYSRQDKKALAREPISAKLVADLRSQAGSDRVVSVDLHSGVPSQQSHHPHRVQPAPLAHQQADMRATGQRRAALHQHPAEAERQRALRVVEEVGGQFQVAQDPLVIVAEPPQHQGQFRQDAHPQHAFAHLGWQIGQVQVRRFLLCDHETGARSIPGQIVANCITRPLEQLGESAAVAARVPARAGPSPDDRRKYGCVCIPMWHGAGKRRRRFRARRPPSWPGRRPALRNRSAGHPAAEGRGVIATGAVPSTDELVERARAIPSMEGSDLVKDVTCAAAFDWESSHGGTEFDQLVGPPARTGRRLKVAAYDFGMKWNILRRLTAHGCDVRVFPATAPASDLLAIRPDGVFLSNGPGDPAVLDYAIANTKALVDSGVPVFGICLGHQILGLALGARTYKLKFGHRGGNHPVKDLQSGKIEITSQNHGFAIDPQSVPHDVQVTHLNLYDGTVEGLRHVSKPVFCVQYHPEAAPGPHDADYLFAQFVAAMDRKA